MCFNLLFFWERKPHCSRCRLQLPQRCACRVWKTRDNTTMNGIQHISRKKNTGTWTDVTRRQGPCCFSSLGGCIASRRTIPFFLFLQASMGSFSCSNLPRDFQGRGGSDFFFFCFSLAWFWLTGERTRKKQRNSCLFLTRPGALSLFLE